MRAWMKKRKKVSINENVNEENKVKDRIDMNEKQKEKCKKNVDLNEKKKRREDGKEK